ncbi:MAG TPA: hypothetical protein VME24_06160 [Alphaproteobacteria bacterium]|nr:hypothetical protein [Alphaproteobacteria bacterium]
MIKWFVKWVFRLALLAVVLVIVLLLSLNTIVRVLIEHNIRAQTGMEAEIGRVEVGWTEPTFEIRDLKIYNPPSFGGTPFLDIPEIHVQYDRLALLKGELHLKLLRLDLEELDVVRSRKGDINVFALGAAPQMNSMNPGISLPSFKKETGYDFKGIDALNFTFNKATFIDLQNRHNDREQTIGLKNIVVPDVKSPRDLAGLVLLIELRSNHFFDPLVSQQVKSAPLKSVLNVMGGAF